MALSNSSTTTEIIEHLKNISDKSFIKSLNRAGINHKNAFGVRTPALREIAREIGKNQALSLELWKCEIHETRLLAPMIGDDKLVTPTQMDEWVADFDSWDICDNCISSLFRKTPFAWTKALDWCESTSEFVRRAGYASIAILAVHEKKLPDNHFISLSSTLYNGASDNRNFVKKAVNWAIRQIGKRNLELNAEMILLCFEIRKIDTPSARWIALNALIELKDEKILQRLHSKNKMNL